MKLFRAIIVGLEPEQTALRVTVLAEDLAEAKKKLEEQYGENSVYGLHSDQDAPWRPDS